MKLLLLFSLPFFLWISFSNYSAERKSYENYDTRLSKAYSDTFNGKAYNIIEIQRVKSNETLKVKTKYFAAANLYGESVYERYLNWALGKKIIVASVGSYVNEMYLPVGLTVDNGVIINRTLSSEFDGLVIVYAKGGVVVSNIADGNLSIKCDGVDRKYDIRKPLDREEFLECAQQVEATFFQTHLLVYQNQMKINYKDAPPFNRRCERRVLAICRNNSDSITHFFVSTEIAMNLFDASQNIFDYLIQRRGVKEVIGMVNLDTGIGDTFQMFNPDGTLSEFMKGRRDLKLASSLLVYYE